MEKEREKTMEESIRLWNESMPDVSEKDIGAAWQIFRAGIHPARQWRSPLLAVAAAFMLLLAGFFIGSESRKGERGADTVRWVETYAELGFHESVELPDHSRVKLKSGSRLLYPDRFDGPDRNVFLSGEAFFEVQKDAGHPFLIHTDNVQVVVTGTTLNVRSIAADSCITTSLFEGKVGLDIPGKARLDLTPGNAMEFNKSDGSVTMHAITPEGSPRWYDDQFNAFNKTLGQIAEDLADRYNLAIEVTDADLAATTFFATFVNGESIWEILSALNIDGTFHVRRDRNHVLIEPEHVNP